MSRLSLIFRRQVLCVVIVATVFVMSLAARVEAIDLEIFNPDWSITLTDHGYADFLLDQRPGFEGREYLSGEWGAAVGYKVGAAPVTMPTWIEPDFIFPDWTTNSDFLTVVAPMTGTGAFNTSGFEIFSSTVKNAHLEIKQKYEFVDTTLDGGAGPTGAGVDMGDEPASSGPPGSSITSNRYVLKQTYGIKNISGENITDLNLFQFLHGLHSTEALYDDRDYGPSPFGAYHYDTTLIGFDSGFGEPPPEEPVAPAFTTGGGFIHEDTITFHSKVAPSAHEVGYYGIDPIDSHVTGKPGTGVHLEVETDTLIGTDFFSPGELWVSGAQKYGLGSLGTTLDVDDSVAFDVLLSIQTETTAVPEPATVALLGIGLAGLAGAALRRRFKGKVKP